MTIKTLLVAFYFFSLSSPAFSQIVYEFEDSFQEKRFYELISEIRCPKCTSGSIASSDVPVSRDLKKKIYQLVLDGSSDEEIKQDSKNVVENISSELKLVINETKSKLTGTSEVNTKFEEE